MKFPTGVVGIALLLSGCVSVPTGPSTLALPGTGKHFDTFRSDEGGCRQYAYDSIGGQSPARAQEDAAVRSGVAGAVIGALVGGAVSGGHGAAVGAGVGGAAGGLAGLGAGEASGYEAQRRYDNAYTQCMYAKGHKVAVSARFATRDGAANFSPPARSHGYAPLPPQPSYRYPPPPPGYYAPRY